MRAKSGEDEPSIMNVAGLCVSALLMAHLVTTFPVDTGTNSSTRLELQELLNRLEFLTKQREEEEVLVPQRDQSVHGSERTEEVYAWPSQRADDVPEEPADSELTQDQLDEALIRELLSAKNLRAIRNNSNRNSSGCFGRRMDRIGSMTSLGCNTGVRNSAKSA